MMAASSGSASGQSLAESAWALGSGKKAESTDKDASQQFKITKDEGILDKIGRESSQNVVYRSDDFVALDEANSNGSDKQQLFIINDHFMDEQVGAEFATEGNTHTAGQHQDGDKKSPEASNT